MATTEASKSEPIDRYLDPHYETIGHIRKLADGVQFYCSGSTESHRAIILIPDTFGWNTGRTRNIADYFAMLGYYVIVPGLLTLSHPKPDVPHHHEHEEGRE
jgi:dienelactone hydrolase